MKRFTNLEFDDSSGSRKPSGNGESVRDAAYFHQRAVQCFLHSDFELALRNYSRALETNSSFFDGWAGQIWMLIELGEYPEAMVWADKALESFPEHPELLAAKAVACLRDAKLDKAKGYSDNSISKDHVGPRVWLARAEVLLQSKSRVADNCLSKALTLSDDESDLIRFEAGRLLRRYGRYSAAVEYLQEAVRLFPKSALAWCFPSPLWHGMSWGAVSRGWGFHKPPLRWNSVCICIRISRKRKTHSEIQKKVFWEDYSVD
jgi:tetratricopeptide (TPR) repeat protein